MLHKMKIFIGGDQRYTWDPAQPETVEAARAAFDEAIVKPGYFAFAVDESGEGHLTQVFDETAVTIRVAPQISGG